MTIFRNTLALAIGLALGFSMIGCAKLNPKTEGQIYSALEAKKEEFQKCYEKALAKDRNVKGEMKLSLKFDPKSKKPEETSIKNTQIQDDKMQKCVKKAASGIRLEDAPGVFVEGFYTVDFRFQ